MASNDKQRQGRLASLECRNKHCKAMTRTPSEVLSCSYPGPLHDLKTIAYRPGAQPSGTKLEDVDPMERAMPCSPFEHGHGHELDTGLDRSLGSRAAGICDRDRRELPRSLHELLSRVPLPPCIVPSRLRAENFAR